SYRLVGNLEPDSENEIKFEFSPDNQRLWTQGNGGSVRLWNAVTAEPIAIPSYTLGRLKHPRFSADGSRLLICDFQEYVSHLLDAKTGQVIAEIAGESVTRGIGFSPNGKFILSLDRNN